MPLISSKLHKLERKTIQPSESGNTLLLVQPLIGSYICIHVSFNSSYQQIPTPRIDADIGNTFIGWPYSRKSAFISFG